METTVTHCLCLVRNLAILALECGHAASVPREDEEGFSLVGSTVECDESHPFEPRLLDLAVKLWQREEAK